jgi:hypothetical protein
LAAVIPRGAGAPVGAARLDRLLPWGIAAAAGLGIFLLQAWPGFYPQLDVYSYYELFHYLYSALFLDGEIPLWQPYASYGVPSAFEFAFTIGPSKALAVLIGLGLRISDIQALYFLGVGFDFALLSLAAAWIVREIAPGSRLAMIYAAVAMPALHFAEWQPNFGYGFALPMLFVILFAVRFFRSFQPAWLSMAVLVLVAFTYGSPQYFLIVEVYAAALFVLACAATHWRALAAGGLRRAATALCHPLWLLPLLPAAGLALVLWRIDRDALETLMFVVPGRDPATLRVPIDIYLTYLSPPPLPLALNLLTGRPFQPDLRYHVGLAGLALAVFAVLHLWRRPFVVPLTLPLAAIAMLGLPSLFPVARWAYYGVPGMDRFGLSNTD